MLANILTLAAVMAGRLEVSTEPVLLAPLIGRWSRSWRASSRTTRCASPSPWVAGHRGDPALVTEVLTNLYENAVKYSSPGWRHRHHRPRDGAWIALAVTDAGIGIPADQLERIFHRFHRVDPASPVRGTGWACI